MNSMIAFVISFFFYCLVQAYIFSLGFFASMNLYISIYYYRDVFTKIVSSTSDLADLLSRGLYTIVCAPLIHFFSFLCLSSFHFVHTYACIYVWLLCVTLVCAKMRQNNVFNLIQLPARIVHVYKEYVATATSLN
jgi:hypothetical protein